MELLRSHHPPAKYMLLWFRRLFGRKFLCYICTGSFSSLEKLRQSALLYMVKDQVEFSVERFFHLTAQAKRYPLGLALTLGFVRCTGIAHGIAKITLECPFPKTGLPAPHTSFYTQEVHLGNPTALHPVSPRRCPGITPIRQCNPYNPFGTHVPAVHPTIAGGRSSSARAAK